MMLFLTHRKRVEKLFLAKRVRAKEKLVAASTCHLQLATSPLANHKQSERERERESAQHELQLEIGRRCLLSLGRQAAEGGEGVWRGT